MLSQTGAKTYFSKGTVDRSAELIKLSSPVPNAIKNATMLIDTAHILGLIDPKLVNETNILSFTFRPPPKKRDLVFLFIQSIVNFFLLLNYL